ncbi:MAG: hypothetical protein ACI9FU_002174 [Granulosicoccus sp.]|jgi:hypothetical protein
MKEDLYEFYQELEHDNLSFIFNGDVSDEVTESIIRLTEHNLNSIEELTKIKKKFCFIMVECFQNLVRHGSTESDGSVFSTRIIDDANYVSSVNKIPVEEIQLLQGKLEQINGLEKGRLKALYLEVLTKDGLSDKGGAGIGLIQLARKTGSSIDFDFEEVNDQLSNFYMSLKLSPNNGERTKEIGQAKQFTQDFDKKIKDSNIVMIYKGDFARDSIMPIIAILEEQMRALTEDSKSKSFFLIIVEMLQNISRHAYDVVDRSGIFMITEDEGKIGVQAGNIVSTKDKNFLDGKIKELNELDPLDLKKLYKTTLREGSLSEKGGAGLGLIEVARKTLAPMIGRFDELGNDSHFFTYSVNF